MIKGLQRQPLTWKVVSSKPGTQIQKLEHPVDGGQERTALQAAPRKGLPYGCENVAIATFSRLHCGAACQDLKSDSVRVLRCPVLPIKARGFLEHQGELFLSSFQVSFRVFFSCYSLRQFSLALLLLPPLYFPFLEDFVIGERVIHVWNARVLIIEGDKLRKVFSLPLFVIFSLTPFTCLANFLSQQLTTNH